MRTIVKAVGILRNNPNESFSFECKERFRNELSHISFQREKPRKVDSLNKKLKEWNVWLPALKDQLLPSLEFLYQTLLFRDVRERNYSTSNKNSTPLRRRHLTLPESRLRPIWVHSPDFYAKSQDEKDQPYRMIFSFFRPCSLHATLKELNMG